MRIVFVVAYLDFGGGIRVIAQYAEGLRRRGHEVLIVSPPHPPKGLKDRIRNKYFPQRDQNIASHFDDTQVNVRILERYRPVLDTDIPISDVIIATWWETAEWIANLPADRGVKVHFVQGYEVWNGSKARVDACLKRSTKKITVSSWLRDILVDELWCNEPTVIFNGVDTEFFSILERRRPISPTVGFVYSASHIKGSDIAIRAIESVKERLPSLRCIAFGHSKPSLDLSLPEYVEYYESPSQEQIRDIYGSCTGWLFSSRAEGFGLPILEAISCGTPVIATPAGAAPDILSNGGGILLDTFESKEMADAILYLLQLPQEQWQNVSDKAVYVSSNFALTKSLSLFEDFLFTAIEK